MQVTIRVSSLREIIFDHPIAKRRKKINLGKKSMSWYKVYANGSVVDVVSAENVEKAIRSVQLLLKKCDRNFTPEGKIWSATKV